MAKSNGQTLDDKLGYWKPKIAAFKAMPAADIIKDIRSLALLISDSVSDLASYNNGATNEVNDAIQKLHTYRALFLTENLEKLGEVYDTIVPPNPKRDDAAFGDFGKDLVQTLYFWRPGEHRTPNGSPEVWHDFSDFRHRLNMLLYLIEIGPMKGGENLEKLQKMSQKKPEGQNYS